MNKNSNNIAAVFNGILSGAPFLNLFSCGCLSQQQQKKCVQFMAHSEVTVITFIFLSSKYSHSVLLSSFLSGKKCQKKIPLEKSASGNKWK